jgi:hypothetical protein
VLEWSLQLSRLLQHTPIHKYECLLKHYEWLICLVLIMFFDNLCFFYCMKMQCCINLRAVL